MLKRLLPPWLALALLFLGAGAAGAQQDALPELVRRVKPSVVSVITYNSKGEVHVTGSGFFVRPTASSPTSTSSRRDRVEIRTFRRQGQDLRRRRAARRRRGGRPRAAERAGVGRAARALETSPRRRRRASTSSSSATLAPRRLGLDGIVSACARCPRSGASSDHGPHLARQLGSPSQHARSGRRRRHHQVTNGQNINLAISAARSARCGRRAGARLQRVSARASARLARA